MRAPHIPGALPLANSKELAILFPASALDKNRPSLSDHLLIASGFASVSLERARLDGSALALDLSHLVMSPRWSWLCAYIMMLKHGQELGLIELRIEAGACRGAILIAQSASSI